MRAILSRILLSLTLAVTATAPASPAEAKAKPAAAKGAKKPDKPAKKSQKPEKKTDKKPEKKTEKKAEKKTDKKAGKKVAKKATKVAKKKSRAAAGVVGDLTKDGKPNVQSHQGIVIDLDTEEVLWARQADVVRPIASVSKLLAAIVVLEKGIDLDAKQTMSDVDERVGRRGAHSRLLRGYTVTNRDLLHAAMLGSDNRAVSAMGRSIGLDAAAFAAAMTQKARDMGLKHTRFGDPTGLNSQNVSTAREVVGMLRYALDNETLSAILRTHEYTAKFSAGKAPKARAGEIVYRSTNRLLRGSTYKIYGGKTGYTDPAKYCFVVAGELDAGRRVAMAFLNGAGELTRFGDFRRVAGYLKQHPPLMIARPLDEAEVTEAVGAVLYKDPETELAAEGGAPTAEEPTEAGGAAPAPSKGRAGGDREPADEDAPR